MREEIERDRQAGSLYLSPRLSPQGEQDYPDLLLDAIDRGDPGTFTVALSRAGRLNETETAVRNGKRFTKRVPVNAAETLGEGEFNRFYARGLCRRAIAENSTHVRVYRAKEVARPRSESIQLVGQLIDPNALLSDLRASIGMDTALNLPAGPNSGLSVELAIG
jgi:hypothetical protein